MSDCGSGNYGDPITGRCLGCGVNCDVCDDVDTCTTCASGYVISDGACLDTCPDNSLLFTDTCSNCTLGCATCDTVTTNCTSCVSGYYLDGTLCETTCPDGSFGDNVSKECISCDTSKCQLCLSLDTCLQCQASYVMLNSKCDDSCLTGYYEDQFAADDRVCKS